MRSNKTGSPSTSPIIAISTRASRGGGSASFALEPGAACARCAKPQQLPAAQQATSNACHTLVPVMQRARSRDLGVGRIGELSDQISERLLGERRVTQGRRDL